MFLFYCPSTPENNVLDATESQHAVKVLRLAKGATIEVINGKGGRYTATIKDDNFKKCSFRIEQEHTQVANPSANIHIAIAPTKNSDRMEWFVEKCIEIGVGSITFVRCQRSERKQINLERIMKIAISAMKQSLKSYMPAITDMVDFKSFVKENKSDSKYIAYVDLESEAHHHLFQYASLEQSSTILIGPEGDFAPEEIILAKANSYQPVSLGNARLRTETAGITACQIMQLSHYK